MFRKYFTRLIALAITVLSSSGCKKFMDTPLPSDSVADLGAYVSDNSVSAVVSGIFRDLSVNSAFYASENIGYRSGLYTDELTNLYTSNPTYQAYYTDELQSTFVPSWARFYKNIYSCNSLIEGLNKTSAKLYNRDQWMGETLFIRGLLYFYLTNLYGDVPIATTTDYTVNNSLPRSPKAEVYKQIVQDLKEAQRLLTPEYRDGSAAITNDRGRPNKFAATALLARVYLYIEDWKDAEEQATTVINNSIFGLPAPANSFLKASSETIWALAPVGTDYVRDWANYNNNMPASIPATNTPFSYQVYACISDTLRNSFETGDLRFANWVRSSTVATTPAKTYYFPNKYKSNTNGVEYQVFLRLAEVYLIRAEVRARQNNLQGAKDDLNKVRTRAGLAGTTATTGTEFVNAILKERQVELFTELGHRFFDLKRTGKMDEVMTVIAPKKGATWASFKQIWPIPTDDIVVNPKLTQAPGYQ